VVCVVEGAEVVVKRFSHMQPTTGLCPSAWEPHML